MQRCRVGKGGPALPAAPSPTPLVQNIKIIPILTPPPRPRASNFFPLPARFYRLFDYSLLCAMYLFDLLSPPIKEQNESIKQKSLIIHKKYILNYEFMDCVLLIPTLSSIVV